MPKGHQRSTPPATENQPAEPAPPAANESNNFGSKVATVAAVGAAAALIEVEWIPGILIGVAAMLVPDLLPRFGTGLRPLIKSAVRAGYSIADRTKETVAEAGEQFQDIVAEVRAEGQPASTPAGREGAPETTTAPAEKL